MLRVLFYTRKKSSTFRHDETNSHNHAMKEIHHICITSHSEIMFRSDADMHYAFNCLAAACVKTDSKLLAFSLLTSHVHIAVITDSADQLVKRFRYRYSCYFNTKYKRKGALGERKWYDDVFNGPRHIITGINYILRQGLHLSLIHISEPTRPY